MFPVQMANKAGVFITENEIFQHTLFLSFIECISIIIVLLSLN